MAHSQVRGWVPEFGRLGPTLAGSTLALTMAFMGLVSLASGPVPGLSGRIPYYVLAAAAVFATALMVLEGHWRDGRNLLGIAVGVAVAAFVVLGLGAEGLVYAARNPAVAFSAQRFLYLLSAALVTTGLGYWTANHADAFVRSFGRSAYRR